MGRAATSGVIKGRGPGYGHTPRKPAIANMSLGGGASQGLDDALRRSATSGVFYSIAAGNDGSRWPATTRRPRAGFAATDTNGDGKVNHDDSNGIVTTAATDKSENDPSWSNYGRCVDIWAPGVSILSTKKGGGVTTMSGTSMAAPHVGGGGALYLSDPPTDPDTGQPLGKPVDVEKRLKVDAKTFGTISNAGGTREITREDVGGF